MGSRLLISPKGIRQWFLSKVCLNIYLPKTFTLIILTNLQQLPKKT